MDDSKTPITFFAKTNFRNREVPFGIKTDDRRRHMYVIGKTGMGKTTMMENMVIQDIRNGHGVCFIDPHGDSIRKILDFVPSSRVNDVVYFNPADLDHPIAFNILESVDTKYKHLVASGLMGVFTKIWANLWSARMEYILNNTILALLDSPGNTMLGIARMYIDKKYRKRIVDNIKDPMVKAFWVDEFANYNEKYRTEAIAPIQNKVGQFLSSAIIRNIVGQPKSTLDLRDIMDNRKILLMDLSKGKVGEDNSALLGAMIITKLQLAALSRVDVPEQDRQDFYLYVDEFQNFVTDSFATILSEARKYRLNLTMGHQYIGQLTPENNTKVRDAVFGNVGSMVVFRVGAADAEYLETEFQPSFMPTDIVNLPKYHIILKLMINGVSSDPFTAVTMPVDEAWNTQNGDKIIKVSRERYGNPVVEVEEKISRWMGAEFHEASAHVAGGDDEELQPERLVAPEPAPTSVPEPVPERVAPEVKPEPQITALADEPKPQRTGIKISAEYLERMSAPKTEAPKPRPGPSPRPGLAPRSYPRHDGPPPRRSGQPPRPYQSGKSKPQGKRSNPIWETASKIEQSKQQTIAENVAAAVGNAFTPSPAPEPVEKPQPQATNPTVIKPGEVHKF
jgi:hypothetical protein